MFTLSTLTFLLALALPLLVRADVTPAEPAPGASFNAGSSCTITWIGDKASTTIWKNMAIELMTGDNYDMVHLTTVATNQDGTVDGSFSYTCPEVTPNSAIYFYQFTSPLTNNATWTGRFTIASSTGNSTPPPNATQPGTGEAIPWGTGALNDPSKAVAAPILSGSGATSSTASGVSLSSTAMSMVRSSSSVMSSSASSSVSLSSSAASPSTSASNGVAAAAIIDGRVWATMMSLGASAMAFMLLL
ncbi:uncharacterized protein LACBIDRAFT_304994 [Laccaria bicolor S238N-H82]|uniref:Predicted protein n=1 Tax=Laccaria bicolor (strain S238N-H82 / ATCC MYA-4686) TaxID=486041 RepID=B0CT41_LACBS|nr:uncharacterized protein LACBIDRAFT_304994 [Laccaria bicolor S238N-H82]EDR14437.1 predicted protein [Laccaria bicolor S238N-H82]|eukprot:XP_001874996.1 predicted protein [Laccaria bicolor S238N-H82]